MPRLRLANLNLNYALADNEGNEYSVESGEKLVAWIRANPEEPKDLSENNLSCEYDDDPPISDARIGRNVYSVIGDQASSPGVIEVSNSTGDLSFTSLPSEGSPTTSSDRPFSISAWVKADSTHAGSQGYIAFKRGFTFGEYRLLWLASDSLSFTIWDNENSAYQTITSDGSAPLAQWNHIVVTYDGRGGTGAAAATAVLGMNIYINGSDHSGARSYSGGYKGMQPNWGTASYPNAELVIRNFVPAGGQLFKGEIAEIALWKTVLPEEDIVALYNTTRGSSYRLFSGYLNNPSRTILHARDSATGSYPTIERDSGFHKHNLTDPFVDNRALDFGTDVTSVSYPFVLSKFDKDRYYENWIDTPNTTGSIGGIPGKPGPGVSDQGMKISINQRGGFTPFDESRIYLDDSEFYLTGTSPRVLQGFSSGLKDKMQIKIDLSTSGPSTGSLVGRWNSWGLPSNDFSNEGEFSAAESMFGIKYYNFITRTWDEPAKYDSVYGVNRANAVGTLPLVKGYAMWMDTNSGNHWTNGPLTHTHKYSQKSYQFAMSDHVGFMANSYDELIEFGYDKIGTPTVSGLAPFSNFYYAPEENQLKMKDYISKPFLLEKAVIEIPIIVRRRHGNKFVSGDGKNADGTSGRTVGAPVDGSRRDIDNYVFFLYRQRNRARFQSGSHGEMRTAVSGSERFLIMSASCAFFNGPTFGSAVSASIAAQGLPHTPFFSHDFNMAVSGSTDVGAPAAGAIGAFSGTLRIEMTAAVSNELLGGGSRFPGMEILGTTTPPAHTYKEATIVVQDYWPGGTGFSVFNTGSLFSLGAGATTGNPLTNMGWQFVYDAPTPGDNRGNDAIITDSRASKNIGYGNTIQGFWGFGSGHMRGQDQHFSTVQADNRPVRNSRGFSKIGESKYMLLYPSGSSWQSYAPQTSCPVNKPKASLGLSVSSGIGNSTPSPYLLFPEDSLVIGIDPGISCPPLSGGLGGGANSEEFFPSYDQGYTKASELYGFSKYNRISESMSGSFMRIETGPASITLFGSQVSAGKEHIPGLDQNLTSDAIHEALHFDNPVVDQYDIASRQELTGSYIDNLIFGVMYNDRQNPTYATPREPFYTHIRNSDRRVYQSLGSGLHGIDKYMFQGFTSAPTGGHNGGVIGDPYGVSNANQRLVRSAPRKSLFRGVRLVDKSEIIFDTVMPDLVDWAARSGMFVTGSRRSRMGVPIIVAGVNGLLNETAQFLEYQDDDGNTVQQLLANKKAAPYATKVSRKLLSNIEFRPQMDGENSAGGSETPPNATIPLIQKAGRTSVQQELINSVFFKQGTTITWVSASIGAGSWTMADTIRVAPAYTTGSATRNAQPYGAQGFLYGIENVRPTNSSAVFRWDRYGQFRDMLEQRRDGKFLNIQSPPQQQEGPVQNIFVDRLDGLSEVPAYQTFVSNTSLESTSSLPLFDGKTRNRTDVDESSGILTIDGVGTVLYGSATTTAPSFNLSGFGTPTVSEALPWWGVGP